MYIMTSVFPILVGVAVTCAAVALIFLFMSSKNTGQKKQKPKSRSSIIRTAEKRLAQDPRDPAALLPLSGKGLSAVKHACRNSSRTSGTRCAAIHAAFGDLFH